METLPLDNVGLVRLHQNHFLKLHQAIRLDQDEWNQKSLDPMSMPESK
jgi:hypothetical protein